MSRRAAFAWIASAILMIAYCALNLRLGTNLQHFMPDSGRSKLAEISSRLTDSAFTRTMVLSVESSTLENSIAAVRDLAEIMREDPGVAWVRTGVDPTQIEDIFELYFPRRMLFLSDDPEREIPAMLRDDALREHARALKAELASPLSDLLTKIAPADPLGSFRTIAERLRASESSLELIDGQFAIPAGNYAIAMLGTRESAFDSGAQMRLLEKLDASFEAIAERRGGGLRLESAGANRFAVAAEQSVKRDVYKIGVCSFLGVAALFFLFIGGWRAFLIVSVPPLAGILVATACGLAILGNLDGLTMAFGASLMGIAIDYSNHLLIHNRLSTASENPAVTVRRIRPSLTLGAATTIASFGGLAVTAFPAFREMSLYAAIGVGAALLATLKVLPALLPFSPALPRRSAVVAAWLGDRLQALEGVPRALLFAPIVLLPAAGIALTKLEWIDDMSELTNFPEALLDEGRRVRERVSSMDSSRFAIGVAKDTASAVELSDRIAAQIELAIDAGELEASRTLHSLLWSEALQRRNWEMVSADSTLPARLNAAFVAEGFRPGAFLKFEEALSGPPPLPLSFADLEASALADFLAPFIIPLGEEIAVISYLRGIELPGALRDRLQSIDGVYLLDQGTFVDDIYSEFRTKTLQQIGVGAILVLGILALRYRHWRPVFAAFLPSVIVAAMLLAILALFGVHANLIHAMSLIMVMGMGVDYGIFLVDSARDHQSLGATMLSLLMSCLTTAFVFGTLALSSQPALRAIGVTVGLGILLCYLLAPVTLAAMGLGRTAERGDA
ncbi:MAG: MMPL family transporter [Deltaproteobacteria bacterium]|nr:MMPL family transporter [Deltaproteobacteria bacterium]